MSCHNFCQFYPYFSRLSAHTAGIFRSAPRQVSIFRTSDSRFADHTGNFNLPPVPSGHTISLGADSLVSHAEKLNLPGHLNFLTKTAFESMNTTLGFVTRGYVIEANSLKDS